MNATTLTKVPAFDVTRLDRGKITVLSTATGAHRTFRLSKGKDCTWVGLLSGPDNQDDYISFARIVDGEIRVFFKHRGSQYEKLAAMLSRIEDLAAAGKVELLRSNNCIRCGRELTEPKSIECGIGPICRRAIGDLWNAPVL